MFFVTWDLGPLGCYFKFITITLRIFLAFLTTRKLQSHKHYILSSVNCFRSNFYVIIKLVAC